jgi:hypothetical protein
VKNYFRLIFLNDVLKMAKITYITLNRGYLSIEVAQFKKVWLGRRFQGITDDI